MIEHLKKYFEPRIEGPYEFVLKGQYVILYMQKGTNDWPDNLIMELKTYYNMTLVIHYGYESYCKHKTLMQMNLFQQW
jgi:hypothetical protein